MAFQYWQPARRASARADVFICLANGYHGDTIGSVSVGGIDLFHGAYRPLLFETHQAEPGDAADARAAARPSTASEIAAVIVEPLVQGAAGILVQPRGLPAPRCASSATRTASS